MSGYLQFYAKHPELANVAAAMNEAGDAFHNTSQWQDREDCFDGKTACETIQAAFDAADRALCAAQAELTELKAEIAGGAHDSASYPGHAVGHPQGADDGGMAAMLLDMLRNQAWPFGADPRWQLVERWADQLVRLNRGHSQVPKPETVWRECNRCGHLFEPAKRAEPALWCAECGSYDTRERIPAQCHPQEPKA